MRKVAVGVAAALGGAILFAYAVRDVGWAAIAEHLRRVGWGLLAILALSGLRFVLRAEAWRTCMPPSARIPFRQALSAYLAGDALGNVTPLGLIASEPTKVFLVRHRLATRDAASSLAIDVFVYGLSVVVMIGAGLVAVAATVPLPSGWGAALLAAVAALGIGVAVAWRLLGGTWSEARGPRPHWRARLATLREAVRAFAARDPARLRRVFLLHAAFHAAAFAEVFVALQLLLADRTPTLAETLVFTALDRVVIVAFKFVPFRIGVDEASSGGVAVLLGWGAATGVALALVKKIRSLAWAAVGLLLIAAHPAQGRPAVGPRGTASVHRT